MFFAGSKRERHFQKERCSVVKDTPHGYFHFSGPIYCLTVPKHSIQVICFFQRWSSNKIIVGNMEGGYVFFFIWQHAYDMYEVNLTEIQICYPLVSGK